MRILLAMLCLATCQAVGAQQGTIANADTAAQTDLKTEVKAIIDGQRQIIASLDELKRLMQTGTPANSSSSAVSRPPASVNVHGEPFRGNPTARVAIIEYADFECPFCRQFALESYPRILEEFIKTGKLKYFFRDFPLGMHPHAMDAARAARCADEEGKLWEMTDSLFGNPVLEQKSLLERAETLGVDGVKFNECLSSGRYAREIQQGVSEARNIGIKATPTFLIGTIEANSDVVRITNGIVGAQPYSVFKAELDKLLSSTP